MSRLLLTALALALAFVGLSATAASAATVHVVGFVENPGAHYIGDGTVEVYDTAGDWVLETPYIGYFEVDVEPGSYTFVFSGSESAEFLELDSVFTVENVSITADQTGMLRLSAPPTIPVILNGIGEDGSPAGLGARLTCRLYEGGMLRRFLQTSRNLLPTGVVAEPAQGFVVPADAEPGSGCTATVYFADDDGVSKEVVLTPDGPNEFTVVEPAPVTVSGHITSPTGPSSRGRVSVYDYAGDEVASVDADVDGDYSLDLPVGDYEFSFEQGGMRVWAHNVSVQDDLTLNNPEPWFPVSVHAIDSAGDSPVPTGELVLDCEDLVGIVGGEEGGLYQQATLVSSAAPPAAGTTATLHGIEIQEHICSLYLVEGEEERTVLFETRFQDGLRDLTYDYATGEVTEGAPSNDDDGVPDVVEDGAPNGGDGNGDGTPDSQQPHVTSLPANGATGGSDYVTVAAPAGLTLSDVSSMGVADAGTPPPEGYSLPSGLVSFALPGLTQGSTHTVSLYMGATDGLNGYAKYDANSGTWSSLPADRVQMFADHVDITLTDGGIGDDDGAANGQITDPGGIAVVPVQADTDPPVVTGSPTTSPNGNGWYRGNVTIDWSATDTGSGVAAQPADTVVTEQGDDVTTQSPEVCDTAPTPNCARGSVTGLKIDKTAPSLSIGGVTDGATYVLGAAPTPSCTASDGLSGLAGPCAGLRVGGNRNGVGSFRYAATVVDRAGNRRTVSAEYRVVYRFDGFASPLNNPPAATSVFRKGSTVLAALSVRRADGRVVTPVSKPVWVTPVRGTRTSLPVNESFSHAKATWGTDFVWRNGRWEYAWSTKNASGGYLYRIGVRLDDGTTRYLAVGVR